VTFIILGSVNALSIILVLIFIPETLNKPLPEDLPPRRRAADGTATKTGKEMVELLAE
jgi:hypothetical protein